MVCLVVARDLCALLLERGASPARLGQGRFGGENRCCPNKTHLPAQAQDSLGSAAARLSRRWRRVVFYEGSSICWARAKHGTHTHMAGGMEGFGTTSSMSFASRLAQPKQPRVGLEPKRSMRELLEDNLVPPESCKTLVMSNVHGWMSRSSLSIDGASVN